MLKNLLEDEARRRRAFIFTIDALLALALVSSLFILFSLALLPPARTEKYFELEQLGFDSLALEYDEANALPLSDADFSRLTGLQRFGEQSQAEASSAAVLAHARFYHYPRLCGCLQQSCVVLRSNYCLNSSDLSLGVFGENYSDVWVSP